jgi:serine/threonine protein kinase
VAAEMHARSFVTNPQTLGPYRLIKPLGRGGMGQVYLAKSRVHVVAVKMIKPEFAADPGFRERFTREVAAARKVSGIYTAAVVDADTDGPVPWLATAYIPGPSLEDAVRGNGPLPLTSLRPLAAGLVEALAAIHAAGIVHRDLKPSNVLLAADGPRVIDFGIAHAAEARHLTQPGYLIGTLGYMSPEQAQGQPVGPASDVFSLGAVLAFAAVGEGPFGAGSAEALLYRLAHETPRLDRVPAELRPLLERCLAKNPAQRPGVAELLNRLDGSQIPANWLPQTIADTLPHYASAQVTPPTPKRPSPTPTVAASPERPRHGKHRQRTAWNGLGSGRLSRVAVAVTAAVLAVGIILGTNAFGNRTGAAPTALPCTAVGIILGTNAFGNRTGAAQTALPCTDAVFDSPANPHHVPIPASGVGIYSAPAATHTGADTSKRLGTVLRGQAVTGTCAYFAQAENWSWFMQVHLGNGRVGYIWVQYLVNGFAHKCEKNGSSPNGIGNSGFGKPGPCPLEPLTAAL